MQKKKVILASRVHKTSSMDLFIYQPNAIRNLVRYFYKTIFNIIHLPAPRSIKSSLQLRFSG